MKKPHTDLPYDKQGDRGEGHPLGRLILEIRRLERDPRHYGGVGPLTPTEIHTIDAIGREEGILMSELAARLGITKGAASQMIGRLEAKALVRRTPHPSDSRSVIVSLEEQGKVAHKAHEELHRSFYDQLRSELGAEGIRTFEEGIEKFIYFLRK
ncbi:MarR family transcriptional regulator [Paenibacillus sp. MZ04-78.2]|uniref:MarR family winged helix-turn-helix transcriptional regulator n=1 Tax=Paenibacillus sp. MZ04-78.2 TaxID=2962034 RepID=UPI0020B6942E|nr:MarR family transcriptional regulator [Paenibacillus sp. MZ04-78.2]MCP3772982.1 MarR family transcriptional regulator [Paenibacillus sp. MZ04-78.2]